MTSRLSCGNFLLECSPLHMAGLDIIDVFFRITTFSLSSSLSFSPGRHSLIELSIMTVMFSVLSIMVATRCLWLLNTGGRLGSQDGKGRWEKRQPEEATELFFHEYWPKTKLQIRKNHLIVSRFQVQDSFLGLCLPVTKFLVKSSKMPGLTNYVEALQWDSPLEQYADWTVLFLVGRVRSHQSKSSSFSVCCRNQQSVNMTFGLQFAIL